MTRLTDFVLRRRRLVLLLWVVIFLLGVAAAGVTALRMTEVNAYPGLPGWEANQAIERQYGTGGYERPFVPVVTVAEGLNARDEPTASALAAAFDALARPARVVSFATSGDARFLSEDGRTTFGLYFPPPTEQGGLPGGGLGEVPDPSDQIIATMTPLLPAGSSVQVTGLDTLAPGVDAGGLDVVTKTGLCLAAAVAVLVLLFRSALALLPVLTALLAVAATYIPLAGLTYLTSVHENAVTLVPLIGLAIAIDYNLVLVTRWQEERARGVRGDDAVRRAQERAGQAVVFSGAVVAIGLTTMVVVPIPMLRSLAVAGLCIAAASTLVAVTLLPVLLSWFGERLDARHRPPPTAPTGRVWTRIGRVVVRHRVVSAAAAGGLLLALAAPTLGVNLTVPLTRNLAADGPGRAGLTALEQSGLGSQPLSAFDVLVPRPVLAAEVRSQLLRVDGVSAVVSGDSAGWTTADSSLLTVVPSHEGGSAAGQQAIERVRAAVPDGVLIGGSTTQTLDYIDAAYSAFPVMLALIALVTLVLLARAFRSLLLPVKAIVVNLLSLAAVLGTLVLVWQWGFGTEALFGLQTTATLGTFIPITLFAFLYGPSMDYEVFLLSRIREEYDRTGSTDEAVVRGVGATARLVTAAALVLFLSFGAMAFGGEYDVAVFASGMALGVLLDATLVRGVLVPATVAIMGRWNWWLPSWCARLLRVPPSPVPTPMTAAGLRPGTGRGPG